MRNIHYAILILLGLRNTFSTTVLEDITHKKIPECDYLPREPSQYNSYTKGNLVCCMCGAGTRLAGDCNPSHPNTTVCAPCHYNTTDPYDRTYINFGPHILTECFHLIIPKCLAPKLLFEGSRTEEARCVCPQGMQEAPSSRTCVKIETTRSTGILYRITEMVQTTRPQAFATSTGASLYTVTKNDHTYKAGVPQTQKVISSPSSEFATVMHTTQTPDHSITRSAIIDITKTQVKNEASYIAVLVIAILVTIGITIYGIIKLCRKNKHGQESKKDSIDADSADATPNTFTEFLNEAQGEYENAAVPPSPHIPENEQAAPLIQDRTEGCPLSPASDANRTFAITVAGKFGDHMTKKDLPRVFRKFLGDRMEADISDIVDGSDSTREKIVQLMNLALRKNGNKLTPDFIRQGLVELGDFQILVDIANEQMQMGPH